MSCSRSTLFLVFSLSCISSILAQDFFQKTYAFQYIPDRLSAMEVLPDGRIFLLGSTRVANDLNERSSLMMLDAAGNVLWAKTLIFGKSNRGSCATLAPDGNLVIGVNAFDDRSALLKISADAGDILWENYFSASDVPRIVGICPLKNGGFAVAAAKANLGLQYISTIFTVNKNGGLVWEKTLGTSQGILARGVAENSSGQVFLMGGSTPAGDSVYGRPILIKLTGSGDVVWNKTYDKGAYASTIQIDLEGNIWLAGRSLNLVGGDNKRNCWIQKLNPEGEVTWSKFYDSGLSRPEEIWDICPTENGDVLVAGSDGQIGSQTFLFKVNSSGKVLWSKKYAASSKVDLLISAAPTVEGDIVAVGITGKVIDDTDWWVIKTDLGGLMPQCCQTDFPLSPSSISPEVDSVSLTFSSELAESSGDITTESAMPVVETLCSSDDDLLPASTPNAFTPNGDMVNDRFRPLLACPPETMIFEVFDRWGKKVFTTNDPKTPGWDGTLDGQPAPADVYAWRLEYEVLRGGERQSLTEKGNVTLLR